MTFDRSYYELLGVSKSADTQTLRKAFHALSKTLHPDTTLLPVEEAAIKFRKLCEAYEMLSDPFRRNIYDKQLESRADKTKPFQKFKQTNFYEPMPKKSLVDSRRPFSGGELFSLLLLCIALLISILLGVGFALADGRALQVKPSWLAVEQSLNVVIRIPIGNVHTSFSNNTVKSTFAISN